MTLRRRNQRWEELGKSNMPLSRLIRHYETFNQTEGKSPKTISWYNNNMLTFETFLERSSRSTMLGDVGIDEAREFTLYLQQKQRWDGNHGGHVKDDRFSPFTAQGLAEFLTRTTKSLKE